VTGNELRKRFLDFFAGKDHLILPSAPLIPERDPTTLFTSAGMQPLKPYFQGVSSPPAPRLASCQKSFRTPDIEEVGDERHMTFFEMLGNFAPTGDYFKEGAIPLAWELVTEIFGLPKDRLRVTVHPTDDEADHLWKELTDVRAEWVYRNDENWWAAGETGPCGPDSEIWYDRGGEFGCGQDDCYPDHCERFLEFWNLVFMQFNRQPDGSLPALPRPGIDTGMGLERIAAILQGAETPFDIDLLAPLIEFGREGAEHRLPASERVVADHLRAMTFVIADGVLPGNEGRGYVLRRVIRRAILHARRLGLRSPLANGVGRVVSAYRDPYPELSEREGFVREAIAVEQERFTHTLEQGMDLFETLAARYPDQLPGEEAFKLHDTFGFPIDLTKELAAERGIPLDMAGFESAMERQREQSRTMTGQRWPDAQALPRSRFTGYDQTAGNGRVVALYRDGREVKEVREGDRAEVFLDETPFYAESGGQVGDTGTITGPAGVVRIDDTQKPAEGVVAHTGAVQVGKLRKGEAVEAAVDAHRRGHITRHHSATHLLHKALRAVLGDTAVQRGSYVGPDHTTFDFAFNRPLTAEELRTVGHLVNDHVRAALPFHESLMPREEATRSGAMALFGEKYGDTVRVVCFGDWTCELCGGTHVHNTAEVGTVLVTSERSVGAGLRRVDMVAGEIAEAEIENRELRARARMEELEARLRDAVRKIERLEEEVRNARMEGGRVTVERRPARVPLSVATVAAKGMDDLRGYADRMLEQQGGEGVVAVTGDGSYVVKLKGIDLDTTLIKDAFGPGGGPPHLVQGKLSRPAEDAFRDLQEALQ
jgi:alanyl-tRNA synthetase